MNWIKPLRFCRKCRREIMTWADYLRCRNGVCGKCQNDGSDADSQINAALLLTPNFVQSHWLVAVLWGSRYD